MEVVYSRISDHHKSLFSSNFANKVGFKTAGSVIPAQTLSVSVPQFQAVLCFPVLISKHYLSESDPKSNTTKYAGK